MKIVKNLFRQIISLENLFTAWEEFKVDKRHKEDVQAFEFSVEQNLFGLHRELVAKRYKHQSYTGFYIRDPKVRHIHKAAARDRVMHHAIFRVLNPIFDKTFIPTSFSCRIGKGVHKGVLAMERMIRSESRNFTRPCFALKCDVKKFFDSIDHQVLLSILGKRIADPETMLLIRQVIESHSAGQTTLFDQHGVPIGNLTSQLFANVYMNEFDQFIKNTLRVRHYARYTDDFVIISTDRKYLEDLLDPIREYLHTRLKLKLHPNKVSIRACHQGIDFLGYVSLPSHGSDAHKLLEVGHPCALRGLQGHQCDTGNECQLRYCWIKADPTFEGMKQLLYEPLDRVIIQQEDPTPVKSNYTLKKFKISQSTIGDDLSIQETEIELNPGLVAVTGGKGSGKTAFVDLIANCYRDRCNTEDSNSFVRRIADENPTIETTITFKDGNEFKKNFNDGTFFEDSEVVYIAQGELENYIGDDSDLDIYVRNLIFESPQVKDTVINFDFDELVTGIDDVQEKISKKSEAIVALEKQTSDQGLQAINLEAKQKDAELKDAEKRLKELEKAQSKEKIKIAQEKQKTIAALKSKKADLMSLKGVLTDAINFLDNEVGSFNESIASINALLKKLEIAETFEVISYKQKALLETRMTSTKTQITKIVSDIEVAQKELESFEAGVKDHAKLLEKKREIVAAIADIKIKREQLTKKEEVLKQAIEDRANLLKQLIEKIVAQKKKYEDIIIAFSAQKAEVLSDLNFGAKISFDQAKFLKTAEDVMDNRKVAVSSKEKTDETLSGQLFTIVDSILIGNENHIGNYVAEVERLVGENKNKLKSSQAITVSDFYRFLYGNYFTVIPTVKYKNTQLSKLSLG